MDNINNVNELHENSPHRTYLVTYSQLDPRKFPTRWSFGGAVVAAFGANNVDYFVAGKEAHQESAGYHYHVAIRLNKTLRWKSAKTYLKDNHDIIVNFANSSHLYAGAYRYATKTDKHPFIGSILTKHPNLEIISNTFTRAINANSAFRNNRQNVNAENNEAPAKKQKQARMKKGDVAMFIVENHIKTELDLMNTATERRNLGDRCLYDYLFTMRRQSRQELVEDAWRFENAQKTIVDNSINRLDKIKEFSEMECNCGGDWINSAKELLEKNNIDYIVFSTAIKRALEVGRQKDNNILLHGPADCGKTFLLKPILKILPNVFANPASSTFGWMGVETANLVFLNDLRWKPLGLKKGNIGWQDLLNLLEGLTVTLPAPMNIHSKHIEVKKVMPIFATSIDKVRYWVNDEKEPQTDRHDLENNMMDARWNYFKFTNSISKDEKRNIPECTVCWAKFVLQI